MIYRNTIGIDIPVDILVPYIQPFLLGFQANGIPNFRRIRLVNELYHRTVQIFNSSAHFIRPEEITPVHKLVQPPTPTTWMAGWKRTALPGLKYSPTYMPYGKPYGYLSYIFSKPHSAMSSPPPLPPVFQAGSKPAPSQ